MGEGLTCNDTIDPCRAEYVGEYKGNLWPTPLHTLETKPAASADPDTLDSPPSSGVCTDLLTCVQGSGMVGKPY